ncbi:MAG: methionyl-tRNA formyltransferase [Bacteroidales bacterium]|nr:methionyl-tRNA formyltransferase [Bacteroidales bacterium]
MDNSLRIIYMGTPEFAVAPLVNLIENNFNVVAVVTAPDKKAGRGQQIQESAVKKAALTYNIPLLQPEKLKDEAFLEALATYKAELQIVVAFRMLPKQVWNMPRKGTFNLHASLLPQYRGAAPINWAVINGEKETGVTTFFINEDIDTGNILLQEKISINDTDNAGIVHDTLMNIGAKLVVKTVKEIESNTIKAIPQNNKISQEIQLKSAPKIFKEHCIIDWNKTSQSIYNHIRGFSPYPGAYTTITDANNITHILKIYSAQFETKEVTEAVGTINYINKKSISITCSDGVIYPIEIQLAGKRKMHIEELLQGFKINTSTPCI